MASLKIVLGNTTVFFISEHDECATNQHNCDENALCFNTVGGHNCVCKPGYAGNGTVCKGREHLWPLLDTARRATISLLLSLCVPFCTSWTLSRLSTPGCWYMARHLHLRSISAPSALHLRSCHPPWSQQQLWSQEIWQCFCFNLLWQLHQFA